MPNAFDTDFVLPDVATMRPGFPILAAEVERLLNCLNVASAWIGSGHAFQQSWQAADVEVAEGVARTGVASWWVHAPSAAHVIVRIRVRAVGSGRVTFSSDDGEDSISADFGGVAPDDGSTWIDVGDLEIGEEVSGLLWALGPGDTVTMDVAGGLDEGDGVGAVVQVAAELLPLSSPLPAEVVDGYVNSATPFDPSTAVAGAPLTAARGHQIETTLAALIRRPLHRFSWSGLSSAFAASLRGLSPLSHLAVVPSAPTPSAGAAVGRFYSHLDVADVADADFVAVEAGGGVATHTDDGASDSAWEAIGWGIARDPRVIYSGHADPLVLMIPTLASYSPGTLADIKRILIRTGDSV